MAIQEPLSAQAGVGACDEREHDHGDGECTAPSTLRTCAGVASLAITHVRKPWLTIAGSAPTTGACPFRIDLKPLGGHIARPTVILVHGTPTLNTLYWTEDRPDSFCLQMANIAGAKSGDVIAFGGCPRGA